MHALSDSAHSLFEGEGGKMSATYFSYNVFLLTMALINTNAQTLITAFFPRTDKFVTISSSFQK